MLNLVREGEEDYIKAIRYRRRLKIFENFLFLLFYVIWAPQNEPKLLVQSVMCLD